MKLRNIWGKISRRKTPDPERISDLSTEEILKKYEKKGAKLTSGKTIEEILSGYKFREDFKDKEITELQIHNLFQAFINLRLARRSKRKSVNISFMNNQEAKKQNRTSDENKRDQHEILYGKQEEKYLKLLSSKFPQQELITEPILESFFKEIPEELVRLFKNAGTKKLDIQTYLEKEDKIPVVIKFLIEYIFSQINFLQFKAKYEVEKNKKLELKNSQHRKNFERTRLESEISQKVFDSFKEEIFEFLVKGGNGKELYGKIKDLNLEISKKKEKKEAERNALELFSSKDFSTKKKVVTELFFLLKSQDDFKKEKIEKLKDLSFISEEQVEVMNDFILQSQAKKGQETLENFFMNLDKEGFFTKIGRTVSEFTELALSILKDDKEKKSKDVAEEVFKILNPTLEDTDDESQTERVKEFFTGIIIGTRNNLKRYIKKYSELDNLGKKYFHEKQINLKESLGNIPNIDFLLSQLAQSVNSQTLVIQIENQFSFSNLSKSNIPEIELNLKESTFMPMWKIVQYYLSGSIKVWMINECEEEDPLIALQAKNFLLRFNAIENKVKPLLKEISLNSLPEKIVKKAKEIQQDRSMDEINNMGRVLFSITARITEYLNGEREEEDEFEELKKYYQEIFNIILNQIKEREYQEVEVPALRKLWLESFSSSGHNRFNGFGIDYDVKNIIGGEEGFSFSLSSEEISWDLPYMNPIPSPEGTQELYISRGLKSGSKDEYEVGLLLNLDGERIHAKRKGSKVYFDGTRGGMIQDPIIREFLSAWDFDIDNLEETDEILEQVILDENFEKSQKYFLKHGILGPAIWDGLYPEMDFEFSEEVDMKLLSDGLFDIRNAVRVAIPNNFNSDMISEMMHTHNQRFPEFEVTGEILEEDNQDELSAGMKKGQIESHKKAVELLNQPSTERVQTVDKNIIEIRETKGRSGLASMIQLLDSKATIISILFEFMATGGEKISFENSKLVTAIIKDKKGIPYTIVISPKRNKKGGLDLQLAAFQATKNDDFTGMNY